jgi:Icc-related predicted phosphoesterase
LFLVWIAISTGVFCFAQEAPVELLRNDGSKFTFVTYGDTRFTDPANTEASNAQVRQELVAAIARVRPAFVCIGGDIVYIGNDAKDWSEWDSETAVWRKNHIAVYPAIGNHEVKGNEQEGLANYFQRFPELKQSRYYSMRNGNLLFLMLDSGLEEASGPQGEWLKSKLDKIPAGVDFVFVVLHHPPLTSQIDKKNPDGGPAIGPHEKALAQLLEERQKSSRARFIVLSSHVHNYERHERNGVIYFVSGGGGAHAYPIHRDVKDVYPDDRVNYHYLRFDVDRKTLNVSMNRVEITDGKPVWSKPDSVVIQAPVTSASNTKESNQN